MTTEWRRSDAVGLAELFRACRLDPVEVADDALDRAARSNAVFIRRTASRARREAEAARARLRDGRPSSPLDGVPVAWKDLFDMTGEPTTAGAAFRRDAPPATADAPLVGRLAEAGLVAIGKTNLSELAFSGLGLNPHYGTPPHPRIPGAVPGGSSSGSAVAVATGIVPLAIGSDTAGSIRVPAAFCDLYGYRPSLGRYPLDGVFPLAPSFDTAGPFARSLRDIVALDGVLTGRGGDARSPPPSRFVVDEAILDDRISAAVRTRFEAALDRLGRAGAVIERRPTTVLADIARAIERDGWLGGAEAWATHEALLAGPDADRLDPAIRARLERGGRTTLAAAIRLYQSRDALLRRLRDETDAGAVLLMPAVAHAPPLLEAVASVDDFARINADTLRLTMIGSFLGMPGVALPLGAGLGLLVTAPDGADDLVFAAAAEVERSGALAPA